MEVDPDVDHVVEAGSGGGQDPPHVAQRLSRLRSGPALDQGQSVARAERARHEDLVVGEAGVRELGEPAQAGDDEALCGHDGMLAPAPAGRPPPGPAAEAGEELLLLVCTRGRRHLRPAGAARAHP